MFYVYVLRSEADGDLYIGSTNDLRRRFREHQEGKSFSTSFRRPFRLAYYEAFSDETEARDREWSLKRRGQSLRHLKARIARSIA
ncbi:MAG: GIY-YIG nuclease family protein [Patescibacteria group bacterium]|nr:GIY-YIG nuclease family protein [Patescibacteria group bacterium]MDE1966017.1 GIY-YIG nuclease family protein [Patescibacteria group bacterium]